MHRADLPIVHLTKALTGPVSSSQGAGDSLRDVELVSGCGPAEVACWVEIQRRALANLPTTVRPPTEVDLRRELFDRAGWQPSWLWFAIGHTPPAARVQGELSTDGIPTGNMRSDAPILAGNAALGTVGLGIRQGRDRQVAVIHRLAVLPEFRRRGIGALLMRTVEQAAREAGYRRLWLETHARWEAALAFYTSQGWEPVV